MLLCVCGFALAGVFCPAAMPVTKGRMQGLPVSACAPQGKPLLRQRQRYLQPQPSEKHVHADHFKGVAFLMGVLAVCDIVTGVPLSLLLSDVMLITALHRLSCRVTLGLVLLYLCLSAACTTVLWNMLSARWVQLIADVSMTALVTTCVYEYVASSAEDEPDPHRHPVHSGAPLMRRSSRRTHGSMWLLSSKQLHQSHAIILVATVGVVDFVLVGLVRLFPDWLAVICLNAGLIVPLLLIWACGARHAVPKSVSAIYNHPHLALLRDAVVVWLGGPTPKRTKLLSMPPSCLCPLSSQLMTDPVCASDGCSYQREPLLAHLNTASPVSPVTGQQLDKNVVMPNNTLREAIEAVLFCNGKLRPETPKAIEWEGSQTRQRSQAVCEVLLDESTAGPKQEVSQRRADAEKQPRDPSVPTVDRAVNRSSDPAAKRHKRGGSSVQLWKPGANKSPAWRLRMEQGQWFHVYVARPAQDLPQDGSQPHAAKNTPAHRPVRAFVRLHGAEGHNLQCWPDHIQAKRPTATPLAQCDLSRVAFIRTGSGTKRTARGGAKSHIVYTLRLLDSGRQTLLKLLTPSKDQRERWLADFNAAALNARKIAEKLTNDHTPNSKGLAMNPVMQASNT